MSLSGERLDGCPRRMSFFPKVRDGLCVGSGIFCLGRKPDGTLLWELTTIRCGPRRPRRSTYAEASGCGRRKKASTTSSATSLLHFSSCSACTKNAKTPLRREKRQFQSPRRRSSKSFPVRSNYSPCGRVSQFLGPISQNLRPQMETRIEFEGGRFQDLVKVDLVSAWNVAYAGKVAVRTGSPIPFYRGNVEQIPMARCAEAQPNHLICPT